MKPPPPRSTRRPAHLVLSTPTHPHAIPAQPPPNARHTPAVSVQVETVGDCYVVAGGLVDTDEEGFAGETRCKHQQCKHNQQIAAACVVFTLCPLTTLPSGTSGLLPHPSSCLPLAPSSTFVSSPFLCQFFDLPLDPPAPPTPTFAPLPPETGFAWCLWEACT